MSTNGHLKFQGTNRATFVGATSNIMFDTTTTSLGIGVTGTDHPSSNLYITGNAYVSSNIAVGGVLTMGTVNVVARHDLESVTATGNTTPLTVEFQNADTSLVTTGNVEVGGKLTVSGNATVSSNLTVSGNVEVGTANLFVDTVSSRIGVGTSSPGYKLHVKDLDDYSVVGRFESKGTGLAGTSSSAYVDVVDGSGHGGYIQGIHDPWVTHGLRLGTWTGGARDSIAMTILNSGRIGIGTTTPGAKLHIGAFDNNHLLLTSANNDYGWKMDTDDQGNGEVPFRIYRRTSATDTLALSIANQNGRINHAHTEKYNFHWNPNVWSYATNAYATELNLWNFTLNVPYDGWIFIKCHAHWARLNSANNAATGGNDSFYAWLSVASRSPDLSANYDSHTGASNNSYDRFHSYQSPDVAGAGSWRDFNHSGFFKVSAGNNVISLRVVSYFTGGDHLNINGGAVSGFYMPRNYL